MTTETEVKDEVRTVASKGPDWAWGCAHCKHGLIDPPSATNYSLSLYIVRVLQALNHQLVFCECLAGTMYRGRLLKAHVTLKADPTWGSLFRKFVDETESAPSMRIA